MRFQQLSGFEKHLQANLTQHGSMFTLLSVDAFERKFFKEMVISYLESQKVTFEICRLDFENLTFFQIRQEMESADLFSSSRVYLFTHLEKASKGVCESLCELVKQVPFVALIFEGDDGKCDGKLYEKLKKEMVTLDLTKEKPWDKKTRFFNFALSFLQKYKKSMQKEALELLYEISDKEFSFFVQEIEKLLCYKKEASLITLEDVETISCYSSQINTYILCEGVAFGLDRASEAVCYEVDQGNFFQLLGQLRFQLHIGMKLCGYLISKTPREEYEGGFSYSVQKNLSRYIEACSCFGMNYFSKAIELLFNLEKKSKTQSVDYQGLWLSLITHLKQMQERAI